MTSLLHRLLCHTADVDAFETAERRNYATNTNDTSTQQRWSPADPLAPGFKSSVRELEFTITNDSELNFCSKGDWSNGSLVISHGGKQLQQRKAEHHTINDATVAISPSTAARATLGVEIESWPWDWWRSPRHQGNLFVRVEARYNDDSLWNGSKISSATDAHRNVTISIQSPTRNIDDTRKSNQLSFHVELRLASSLRTLQSLSVYRLNDPVPALEPLSSPSWHVIGEQSLTDICFDRVDIFTSNASIEFAHLEGDFLTLSTRNGSISGTVFGTFVFANTSNGHISGSWEGRDRLHVNTSNAHIRGVYRVGNGSEGMKLITKNGTVDANIEVFEDLDEKATQEPVKIEVNTSNSPVKLNFLPFPEAANIDCLVGTSNGRVELKYAKPFKGTIDLQTSSTNKISRTIPTDHSLDLTTSNGRTRLIGKIVPMNTPDTVASVKVRANTSNASMNFTVA